MHECTDRCLHTSFSTRIEHHTTQDPIQNLHTTHHLKLFSIRCKRHTGGPPWQTGGLWPTGVRGEVRRLGRTNRFDSLYLYAKASLSLRPWTPVQGIKIPVKKPYSWTALRAQAGLWLHSSVHSFLFFRRIRFLSFLFSFLLDPASLQFCRHRQWNACECFVVPRLAWVLTC